MLADSLAGVRGLVFELERLGPCVSHERYPSTAIAANRPCARRHMTESILHRGQARHDAAQSVRIGVSWGANPSVNR